MKQSGIKHKDRTDDIRRTLINLPRSSKAILTALADVFGFAACAIITFWLLDTEISLFEFELIASLAAVFAGITCVWLLGLYRSVIRYVGLDLLLSAARISLGASIGGGVATAFLFPELNAVKWGIVYFSLALIYVTTSRYVANLFLLYNQSGDRENVLVYGAGSAGAQLVVSLRSSVEFNPVAIIDDDQRLIGKRVKGLEVYGPENVEMVIDRFNVDRVLLAMPGASRRRRRQVLELLSQYPVHVQTIPSIGDLVSGKARVDDISDVDVEDLLGRDAVPPNQKLLEASIRGKSVMVTGAGGSIGSELCRQILALHPKRLIILDMSEAQLYHISRELSGRQKMAGTATEVVPLLGSVHHETRMREIINNFGVKTIYHAAAYKHVPIVEHNLFEGIHNNIFGTLHTVRAAMDCNIETFVLISTDKAVNPTNVMGATKRIAEMILQACDRKSSKTKFCMVRFGNVLESSGSVVPLFREQIRAGGPVTVTHRDIIRYFMTIPEAAQLVIQASALAKGGEVFVLDMGKPVKIDDLARRMINLMGLTVRDAEHPDGDIAIEYIGLRPAEKLYEELLIGSNVKGTDHPRIMTADEDSLPTEVLNSFLDQLKIASANLDYVSARRILIEAVKEYQPPNGIEDLVCRQANLGNSRMEPDTVVDFPKKPA